MTLKPALALLLVVLIALALGRTFLAASSEADDQNIAIERDDLGGDPNARDADLAVVDGNGRDATRTAASNGDPVAGAGSDPAADAGGDIESEKRQLTVLVEWPEGSAPAEGLVVYALRRDVPSGDLARTLTSTPDTREKDDRYAFFEELENNDMDAASIRATILSEAPLTGDAESGWSAQLAVPVQDQHVFVQAFGGGAFTTASVEVFSPAESVTIRPEVGARLEVIVRPPQGSGADVELAKTRVRLRPTQTAAEQMGSGGGAGSPFGTSVDLDEDGKVLLTTVPAGMPLKLRLRNKAFAPMNVVIESLARGEQRVLELGAQIGAQASGRIIGSDGLGLEGARVTASIPGQMFGFDDEVVSRTASDENGEFVLEHLPDGPLIVRADIDHALQSGRIPIKIMEGRAVSDMELTLDEGRAIAGVARYETGEVAAGVTVDATFDLAHIAGAGGLGAMRGSRGRTTTNADGTFRVTGLGAGPFSVRASGEPDGADSEVWQVREDGVQPGAESLVLELRLPLHVAGTVVDDAGQPLPGVDVDCSRLLDGSMGDVRMGNEPTKSDAEGHFRVDGLVAGRWTLTVSADTHVSLEDLVLDVGPSVDGAEIVAVRTGTIAGTVLDAAGAPIAGATIEQEHEQPMWMKGISRVAPSARTRSTEDGTFLLLGVRPGTVFLTASAPELSPGRSGAIEIASGATVEDVELRLMQGGTIEGLCFDNDGRPVGGRVVRVQSTTLSMMRQVSTGDDGTFVVRGLQTGTYQLISMDTSADLSGDGDGAGMASMFESMDMATAKVVEGETVIVYIGAPPAEPVEVKGRVERAGEPLAGVTLVWMPASKGMYDQMKMATTTAEGDYAVTLDASGDFLVSITRFHGGTAQQETIEYHEAIPTGAKEHERDFEVPGGTIAGRIFGADDEPLSGARVSIMEVGGMQTNRMMGGSYAEVPSAADGTFEVSGLRAGTYQVAAGGSARLGTSTSAPARTIVGGFSLAKNQRIDGVEIHLSAPGAVQITVRDGSGASVPDATIFLRDGEGRHTELFSMIVTGRDGSVTVPGLAPGRYTVAARTEDLASQESTAVDVIEGRTATVEVMLEPGGTIVAVLRAKGDAEIPVASVQVLDAQGRDVTRRIGLSDMRSLYTDAVFSLRERRVGPVPPGRYKVLATSADGRKAKKYVTVASSGVQRVTLVLR